MTELTFSASKKYGCTVYTVSPPMWPNFWESFPYGDLVSSQGQYQNSVEVVLEKTSARPTNNPLDLLDLQWVVFVEQLANPKHASVGRRVGRKVGYRGCAIADQQQLAGALPSRTKSATP